VIRTRRPLLALCALLAALGVGYGVKAVDGVTFAVENLTSIWRRFFGRP